MQSRAAIAVESRSTSSVCRLRLFSYMARHKVRLKRKGSKWQRTFWFASFADYIGSGEPLPEPKKRTGKKYRSVPLPALASVKAELYRAFLASGVRKAELARRLGMAKGNLDRLFDSTHSTRLEHLEAAFLAIGKRLDIGIREAA